jgi:hypothetical protein
LVAPVFLDTIERSALSTWIRESDSLFSFYFILLLHTFGLALLVGANTVVDLRLLGVPSGLPIKPLKKLFRIMWMGFTINLISGIFLIIAYPTKALTNPIFYVKLSLITVALVVMSRIQRRVFDDPNLSEDAMMARGAMLARFSLVLWLGAITAGRLLAYTYTYLLYNHFAPGG